MLKFWIKFFCVLYVIGLGEAMAANEIAHQVIKEEGNIQIREYETSVTAEVQVKSSREEAPGKAFRTLFNFISGKNTSSQKISMTTPVSQKEHENGVWTISFYMPNEMSLEDIPKPKDTTIKIEEVKSRKMISIRFSGRSTDSNIFKHEKELRKYLKKNKLKFKDKPIYAFYNAPFIPWFLRRNEVLFELI